MKYYAIIKMTSLGIYPREMKLVFTQKFMAALFKIEYIENTETTQISINWQMDKVWYMHTVEYSSE